MNLPAAKNRTHDPINGRPWTLCSPTVSTATELVAGTYARCHGCKQPVAVDKHGTWAYITTG